MMKKVLCLMMAWCLLAVPTALAAEDLTGRPLADGVVSRCALPGCDGAHERHAECL